MGLDELFRLHKHAARTAAGIIDFAMVWVKHRDKCFDNTGRCIELPALLTFSAGELAEEVFINLSQQITSLIGVTTETDGRDQVDQLTKLAIGQLGTSIALVEDVFQ
ncbi:hypothetical protein D3C84_879500 [compost metagenome]